MGGRVAAPRPPTMSPGLTNHGETLPTPPGPPRGPRGQEWGALGLKHNREGEQVTKTKTPPRLWTLRELAEAMGVHPDSLRQRANRGTLGAVKMGRDWFVPEAEAQRVLGQ